MSDNEIVTIDSRFLQTCDIPVSAMWPEPFTLVIFGGAGDLSTRKLIPSLYHLFTEKELNESLSILSFDRIELTDETYRSQMREAVEKAMGDRFNAANWEQFASRLFYLSGRFEDKGSFTGLSCRIDQLCTATSKGSKEVIFYMSVPPQLVPVAVDGMNSNGLCRDSLKTKIVVEKPFGEDRGTAKHLNYLLTEAFRESQIYRIDHYLAKEPVDNIIFFRFSNTLFEEVWNRRYVDHVQITVAEEIGIEHRALFYEKAGIVRDIVQNHMLQILSLMAMEAPVGFTPDFIRDEKIKIVRSIRPFDAGSIDRNVVFGQYGPGKINGLDVPGYREEPLVSVASRTPTFFAAKLYVDNLRWAGVPFYLRAGKRLPRQVTEICIQFKRLPLRLFGRTCDVLEPNVLFLTIQPEEEIALRFLVKYPYSSNQVYATRMRFSYSEAFNTDRHLPYERLLLDIIGGDQTLFVREDTIEEMWAIVDPINNRWEQMGAGVTPNYTAGTWGPAAAERLMTQEGREWLTK
jgi:glucose-6-phosphate 1-dehydrogenase